MRNPSRWRNVGVGLVLAGVIALLLAFLIPGALNELWLGMPLLGGGMIAVIFGGLWTSSRQEEARAEAALRRGDDVIARWRVDPRTWAAFVDYDRTIGVNAFRARAGIPGEGVEVIVGAGAIMVDGVVRTLCRSGMVDGQMRFWGGDWIVERAGLLDGPPSCIGLYARMRNARGAGVYANLVFPLGPTASSEARAALAHLQRRAADHAAAVAAPSVPAA